MASKEFYVAADIEADGPIPGPYSMLSLGLCVVGNIHSRRFYTEMKPISDQWDPKAMDVNKLDREKLKKEAPDPHQAMAMAASWVDKQVQDLQGHPVLVLGPAVWDGMWIHWYFMNFLKHNPFGVTGSGIDFRSYWMGMRGLPWKSTGKRDVRKTLRLGKEMPHTHRADEDAAELAWFFEHVLQSRGTENTEKSSENT